MKNHKPLVSVWMITYNQEELIKEAIDSVLMQEVDFEYEIVIGEDCSTDRTREVLEEYNRKYPGKFKLLFREKNLGITANFADTFRHCSGKYIAPCEGDDYWTDPLKLKKQVDILENDDSISLVFQNGRINYFDENLNLVKEYDLHEDVPSGYVEANQLVRFKRMTLTAGTMFKNVNVGEFLSINNSFMRFVDTPTFLYLAKFGRLYYQNEVTSVYRVLSTGGVRSARYLVESAMLDIQYYRFLGIYFSEFNLKTLLRYPLCDMYYLIAFGYFKKGEIINFMKYLGLAFFTKPTYFLKKSSFQFLKKLKLIDQDQMIRQQEVLQTSLT